MSNLMQHKSLITRIRAFQADESPAQFWAFAEDWAGRGGSELDSQDCWADITAAAARHVPPSLGRLLPVVLASRQYSPRLELFATLAAESAPSEQVQPHHDAASLRL